MSSQMLNVFMPRMFAKKKYDEMRGAKIPLSNTEFEDHMRMVFAEKFCGDFTYKISVRDHIDTNTLETYFTAKVTFCLGETPTENIQRFFKDVSAIDPTSREFIKLNLPENRFWKVIPDKKPFKSEKKSTEVFVVDAY